VLGSVGALICAIYLGLMETLLAGGVLYLAALAIVARAAMPGRDAVINSVPFAQAPLN
jgi:hypothetical protein